MNEPCEVHYRVVPIDPAAHLLQVTTTIARPDPAGQVLRMPTWIPGSYTVRDFARHVVDVHASSDGTPVPLFKQDSDTWRAAPVDGALQVVHRVYAWELTVRTAHVDRTHAFWNGPNILFEVLGHGGPLTIDLEPGPDPACASWQIATALPRVTGDRWGFGRFRCADWDELLDHPVEMGTWQRVEFDVCGVPHHLVVTGRVDADLDRIAADLQPICEAQVRMFGERPPMDEFLFLITVVGKGYGGLEHRASTALIASRGDLPRRDDPGKTDGYRDFLGLCSHEYFHCWNVKRIKPARFVPFDLTRPTHTELLWAFEGITSYYDDLGLLRAGTVDTAGYLERVARTATRVHRFTGRLKQPLADSSFDAWTKLYKPNENSVNSGVSYYTKGALTALALDLTLRLRSAHCLDDVMRVLWERRDVGVAEDGVQAVAEELTGLDLSDFFAQALRSTEDLPLPELLARFGVSWTNRPQDGRDDSGGKPRPDERLAELRRRGWLGISVSDGGGGARIDRCYDDGPAMPAGLSAGDVIIACDGLKVDAAGLRGALARRRPGDAVNLHVFRDDELFEAGVSLVPPPETTVVLSVDENADAGTRARREAWLGAPRSQT
jgi:predicted metalloprotease with PDZ domain